MSVSIPPDPQRNPGRDRDRANPASVAAKKVSSVSASIEPEKAKERMADGGRGANICTPSGKSRDKAAEQFGIYADQRIGEILRELPKGKGNQYTSASVTTVTTPTKREAEKQAGVSHKTAIDLQKMADNPEVVEAVIAKSKERMDAGKAIDHTENSPQGETREIVARHHPPT